MDKIEKILKPKSRSVIRQEIKEMTTWEYLHKFGEKSPFMRGVGLKKRFFHVFSLLAEGNGLFISYVFFATFYIISVAWNIFFMPYSSFLWGKPQIIDMMGLFGFMGLIILVPISLLILIFTRVKCNKYIKTKV
jgi:hypothetical protein